ncbi:MAG: branched-chain amino acid ABC transporter permease, partial [Proteobacteria bacterium]
VYASFWAIVCFFVVWRLVHSSHGRGFLSVREDEIAAEAMGINTTKMKVRAFVLSSFFAGVAGALFAHVTNFISPSSFTFLMSVNAVIMVVLGGMGSMSGSITAAVFITIMPEALRSLQQVTGVDLRMVIYALLLIIIMIWKPKGLFGNSEITDIWRKYVRKSA